MFLKRLQYWIEMALRRRRILTLVSLSVFGALAVVSTLWPPRYRSTAKVLVHADRAELLVSPGIKQGSGNDPAVITSPVTEQDLNSETELLTSRYLIERTLAASAPAERTGSVSHAAGALRYVFALPQGGYDLLHGVPAPARQEILAQELARKLSVSVVKRSNVIEVSFRSHDPRLGQDFLGHLLDQYQELHALISHDPKAERFFRVQAGLLAERLHKAEEQLQSTELRTGITDLVSQRTALVNQLYLLEADNRKTAAELAAAREQIGSIEKQLASTPEHVAKQSRVVQNLALQSLKPQILQLEAERGELLSRYRPHSARIREIDAKLAAAQKIVTRENRSEVQETTTELNPTWLALDASLAQTRSQTASLVARELALRGQVEEGRAQLRALATDGLLVERTQREVDAHKEAYLSYLRKGEEARAAEALNQSKILNVSVVQPPSRPLEPEFPSMPFSLAAAVMLGLAFGLCAAYAEERSDPRLYSGFEVVQLTGLPDPVTIAERM